MLSRIGKKYKEIAAQKLKDESKMILIYKTSYGSSLGNKCKMTLTEKKSCIKGK
jgi:hypothetical protein